MKIYRVSLVAKLYVIIFSFLLFIAGGIFVFIRNPALNIIDKIIIFFGFILAIGGSYTFVKIKIVIDEQKIDLFTVDTIPIFLGQGIKQVNLSLYWHEVGEVHTNYFLFAETPNVILKPKEGLNKKRIEFIMAGFPLNLLHDILAHLPPDAKVNLYPYLKRKLEGKQTIFYTK